MDSRIVLGYLLGSLLAQFWRVFGGIGSTFGTLAPTFEVLGGLKNEAKFWRGSRMPPRNSEEPPGNLRNAPGSPQGKGLGWV